MPGICTADADRDAVQAATWPVYNLVNDNGDPQNFVFEQNTTSHTEVDTYRAEGLQYIGELMQARHGLNCSGLVACGANNTI